MAYELNYTHRVAVGVYVFDGEGRLLLLKRRNPPLVFAPPGGRLAPDEDPREGARREVKEEAGIDVKILGPALVWFGHIIPDTPPVLGIDFVGRALSTDIKLSDEHSEFVWAEASQITAGEIPTVDQNGSGYAVPDIIRAFELYEYYSLKD